MKFKNGKITEGKISAARLKNAKYVLQDEFSIVCNRVIGTSHLLTCIGLIIYDPKSRLAGLAHFSHNSKVSTLAPFFDLMNNGNPLQIMMVSAAMGSKETTRRSIKKILNFIKKYSKKKNQKIGIKYVRLKQGYWSCSFDSSCGVISVKGPANFLDHREERRRKSCALSHSLLPHDINGLIWCDFKDEQNTIGEAVANFRKHIQTHAEELREKICCDSGVFPEEDKKVVKGSRENPEITL